MENRFIRFFAFDVLPFPSIGYAGKVKTKKGATLELHHYQLSIINLF